MKTKHQIKNFNSIATFQLYNIISVMTSLKCYIRIYYKYFTSFKKGCDIYHLIIEVTTDCMHGYVHVWFCMHAFHMYIIVHECAHDLLTHTQTYIIIIYYVKTYEFMNTRTYTRQQLIQQFWKLVYTCYRICYHYCSKINGRWPILNEKLGDVNYNIIIIMILFFYSSLCSS